jgi:hypothetical protein
MNCSTDTAVTYRMFHSNCLLRHCSASLHRHIQGGLLELPAQTLLCVTALSHTGCSTRTPCSDTALCYCTERGTVTYRVFHSICLHSSLLLHGECRPCTGHFSQTIYIAEQPELSVQTRRITVSEKPALHKIDVVETPTSLHVYDRIK